MAETNRIRLAHPDAAIAAMEKLQSVDTKDKNWIGKLVGAMGQARDALKGLFAKTDEPETIEPIGSVLDVQKEYQILLELAQKYQLIVDIMDRVIAPYAQLADTANAADNRPLQQGAKHYVIYRAFSAIYKKAQRTIPQVLRSLEATADKLRKDYPEVMLVVDALEDTNYITPEQAEAQEWIGAIQELTQSLSVALVMEILMSIMIALSARDLLTTDMDLLEVLNMSVTAVVQASEEATAEAAVDQFAVLAQQLEALKEFASKLESPDQVMAYIAELEARLDAVTAQTEDATTGDTDSRPGQRRSKKRVVSNAYTDADSDYESGAEAAPEVPPILEFSEDEDTILITTSDGEEQRRISRQVLADLVAAAAEREGVELDEIDPQDITLTMRSDQEYLLFVVDGEVVAGIQVADNLDAVWDALGQTNPRALANVAVMDRVSQIQVDELSGFVELPDALLETPDADQAVVENEETPSLTIEVSDSASAVRLRTEDQSKLIMKSSLLEVIFGEQRAENMSPSELAISWNEEEQRLEIQYGDDVVAIITAENMETVFAMTSNIRAQADPLAEVVDVADDLEDLFPTQTLESVSSSGTLFIIERGEGVTRIARQALLLFLFGEENAEQLDSSLLTLELNDDGTQLIIAYDGQEIGTIDGSQLIDQNIRSLYQPAALEDVVDVNEDTVGEILAAAEEQQEVEAPETVRIAPIADIAIDTSGGLMAVRLNSNGDRIGNFIAAANLFGSNRAQVVERMIETYEITDEGVFVFEYNYSGRVYTLSVPADRVTFTLEDDSEIAAADYDPEAMIEVVSDGETSGNTTASIEPREVATPDTVRANSTPDPNQTETGETQVLSATPTPNLNDSIYFSTGRSRYRVSGESTSEPATTENVDLDNLPEIAGGTLTADNNGNLVYTAESTGRESEVGLFTDGENCFLIIQGANARVFVGIADLSEAEMASLDDSTESAEGLLPASIRVIPSPGRYGSDRAVTVQVNRDSQMVIGGQAIPASGEVSFETMRQLPADIVRAFVDIWEGYETPLNVPAVFVGTEIVQDGTLEFVKFAIQGTDGNWYEVLVVQRNVNAAVLNPDGTEHSSHTNLQAVDAYERDGIHLGQGVVIRPGQQVLLTIPMNSNDFYSAIARDAGNRSAGQVIDELATNENDMNAIPVFTFTVETTSGSAIASNQ